MADVLKAMENSTLDYYDKNADDFIKGTVSVDFSKMQDKFISLLTGEKVLDFGCGSGRDTKYFLDAGLVVTAVDGSETICEKASEYTGIKVKQMLFQDLNEESEYDGIWASASVLHLSKEELKTVFEKMVRALRENGIIYTSFKYGDFEGLRKGRYFTDFTIDSFRDFIENIDDMYIKECWITYDVRPQRREEKWLNLIISKQ